MKKIFFPGMAVLLVSYTSWSQDGGKHLSRQEAISAAISNNDAVKLSQLDVQIAGAKFRLTDAVYLPQVNFSYSAFVTDNSLNAFGFKLQQQLISEKDFTPFLLNSPSATLDFASKIELQQPLLNIDMLYQRKSAAKEIDRHRFAAKRIEEQLGFYAEKAYLQLQMAYEEDKVLHQSLLTAKAVYKTAKDYYDQGLIQRSDLLMADVHVMNMETQLKHSESNIRDASDLLGILMGKSAGIVYSVDPLTMNNPVTTDSLQVTDNRADFKAVEKGIEGYDLMIKSSRMSFLPKLNAAASYQLNANQMFGANAGSYQAGVYLSWNIFSAGRTRNTIARQNLEKAKLVTQLKQQKMEAAVQVNIAKHQLSDASFAIKQASLAVVQSLEALRVLQNRYAQGLVKTSDVLAAQTQLSQQQLAYVQAIFSYNLAAAYTHFLTTDN